MIDIIILLLQVDLIARIYYYFIYFCLFGCNLVK